MLFRSAVAVATLALSTYTFAAPKNHYEVTITNITQGQSFTPQLLATHSKRWQLFELGQPASGALEVLAEGGDTQPLTDELEQLGHRVGEVKTIPGLLTPGQSVVTKITTDHPRQRFLSMAAMLIPTNDTFVAINQVPLPRFGERTVLLKAYDAGTELNDQNCANIPGPRCGGAGVSETAETDEGYVYISSGFHGVASQDAQGNEILGAAVYDWNNPVAKVTIRRLRHY